MSAEKTNKNLIIDKFTSYDWFFLWDFSLKQDSKEKTILYNYFLSVFFKDISESNKNLINFKSKDPFLNFLAMLTYLSNNNAKSFKKMYFAKMKYLLPWMQTWVNLEIYARSEQHDKMLKLYNETASIKNDNWIYIPLINSGLVYNSVRQYLKHNIKQIEQYQNTTELQKILKKRVSGT